MAILASLKGVRLPRLPARSQLARRPGRLVVLVWSLAAVAATAAILSGSLKHPQGVHALVTTGPAVAATVKSEPKATPQATLIDPAEYRRPPPPGDGRPRVAVIVRGLGLSREMTARAATGLPTEITLAFSAYGRELQRDADGARVTGHEVFLDVPVEPLGYPGNDSGPQALLTTLKPAENAARLDWALARFMGFSGLVFAAASPAMDSTDTILPLVTAPSLSNLVWAHSGARGLADARVDLAAAAVTLDAGMSADEIDKALDRLEAIARNSGTALAIVVPTPVTLDRLKVWTETLDGDGFQLVPASALAVSPGT